MEQVNMETKVSRRKWLAGIATVTATVAASLVLPWKAGKTAWKWMTPPTEVKTIWELTTRDMVDGYYADHVRWQNKDRTKLDEILASQQLEVITADDEKISQSELSSSFELCQSTFLPSKQLVYRVTVEAGVGKRRRQVGPLFSRDIDALRYMHHMQVRPYQYHMPVKLGLTEV